MDDDRVRAHPVEIDRGVSQLRVVQREDAVAEVIDHAVEQVHPIAVERGENVLIRQQEHVLLLVGEGAHAVHVQVGAQGGEVIQQHAGVDVRRRLVHAQARGVELFEQPARVRAGHEIRIAERRFVQRCQGVNDDRVRVEVEDALERVRQQQGRRDAVIDLARVALRLRKAVEHRGVDEHEVQAYVRQRRADARLVAVREVGVQDEHLVVARAAVQQHAAHAVQERGDVAPVDRKEQVHDDSS